MLVCMYTSYYICIMVKKRVVDENKQKLARQHFFDKCVFLEEVRFCMSGKNEEEAIKILEFLGYKIGKDFVRQYPIGERFVMDFAFVKEKIAIEIDGDSHKKKKQRLLDRKRDAYLQNNGWVSIRIQEEDLFGYKGSFYKNLIKLVVKERREQWYRGGILYAIDIPNYVDQDYDYYG